MTKGGTALWQILKEMDSIYNVLVTFRDLNAWMCGLKQGTNEPIKAYYERMADISVKLEQYHGDCFGPGELKMMKDCFYAGLKEHNKYLVLYMKDRDQYGPAQMLEGDTGAGGLALSSEHYAKAP